MAIRPDIRTLTLPQLQEVVAELRQPAFRAGQIAEWLYRRKVISWAEMTNVPAELRRQLAEHYDLHALRQATSKLIPGEAMKFLWRLRDGQQIESVLLKANPALYGQASDRRTLCISTQVGCAYGCKFCASGLAGWKRNLQADEIVEQFLATERWLAGQKGFLPAEAEPTSAETTRGISVENQVPKPGRLIHNLVIMGMGEPLANYEALLQALKILNAPWGGDIGARKITISTSGLAPQIRRLADEPFQFRLAISLHGATDEVRTRIMPVNRKYPLRELLAACDYYVVHKGKMITLEYVLIEGVNDQLEQVKSLAEITRRLHAKLNLIPYNHVSGLDWQRPSENHQKAFLNALLDRRVPATLRQEKGHDIDAACGQLRLRTEQSVTPQAPA